MPSQQPSATDPSATMTMDPLSEAMSILDTKDHIDYAIDSDDDDDDMVDLNLTNDLHHDEPIESTQPVHSPQRTLPPVATTTTTPSPWSFSNNLASLAVRAVQSAVESAEAQVQVLGMSYQDRGGKELPSDSFLDKLNVHVDTAVKTRLLSSAVGELLPGERVVMFLNSLGDVRDSRGMMLVGSGGEGKGGEWTNLGREVVWCCVVTFYRVVVFSYFAEGDGRVLFDDDDGGVADGVADDAEFTNTGVDHDRIQRWIQSQSVSVQFQAAHQLDPTERTRKQHHHLFEMPLASIERVERILSTSQASIAGITPSSSLNSYSYQNILPSSSAMSQLGSQMKPLLGSMTSNATNTNPLLATNGTLPLGILLHGKDGGRWIQFSTNSAADAVRANDALHTYAFPGRRNLGYLFAFESRRAEVMAEGQGPIPTPRRFVPMPELERMGIFREGSPWVPILNANANYGLCSSYPSVLVGPRSVLVENAGYDGTVSDNALHLLRRCAAFRSENRFPTLTWGSSKHGGSIWRSSQPKVGLQGNRSMEDERYLDAIGHEAKRANLAEDRVEGDPSEEYLRMLCGRNNEVDLIREGANPSCMLKIMDMRPKSAAMANRTQGYGYENTNYYRGVTIHFYGIGNIHAVRDAYQKINALCIHPDTNDVQWMQLVENTNWPSMTRLILSASWQTAFHVHYNRLPVLLHCSHGWDRTSQVAVLAQLMLDPHYRTIAGFSTLVEKDFMSFGHPFHTRCGHGEGKNEQGGDEGQLSPVFLQFLDCVFQLVNQFPDYFEFNSRYLLLLSEHIYSCRFGTLLCDSEREREVVAGIRQRTYCLWEYLDSIPGLGNPGFKKEAGEKAGVLLMPLPMLLRNVTLWTDRFCMYGAKATIPCIPPRLPRFLLKRTGRGCSEPPLILHTARDPVEATLRNALDDADMWKATALSALREVEELKKKVKDGC